MKQGIVRLIELSVDEDEVVLQNCSGKNYGIVVLSVSGGGVAMHPCSEGDPIVNRIERNEDIYCTKWENHICYVRRERIAPALSEHSIAYIAAVVVGMDAGQTMALAREIQENFSVKPSLKNSKLRDVIMGEWYRRLRLPVLMFLLVALIVNLLLFSSLNSRVNVMRAIRQKERTQEHTERSLTEQKKRMVMEYQTLSLLQSSLDMDYVASLIPSDIQLILMSAEKSCLRIKGKTQELASVITLSKSLKNRFSSVEILSMEQPDELYCFDLQITR